MRNFKLLTMKNILSFFILTLISVNSNAASYSGKIQSIATGPNLGNTILVRVEGHSTTAPWSTSCSTSSFWSFKFDSSVPGGKEAYSQLLAAYASQSLIVIEGTNSCTGSAFTDIQNMSYVRFYTP